MFREGRRIRILAPLFSLMPADELPQKANVVLPSHPGSNPKNAIYSDNSSSTSV